MALKPSKFAVVLIPDIIFSIGTQGFLFSLFYFFSDSEAAPLSLSPFDLNKLYSKGHRHVGSLVLGCFLATFQRDRRREEGRDAV